MPWIENVAAADVPMRFHHEAGPNSMLIQIMDPCPTWWPTPAHEFREVYRFEFMDVERDDKWPDEAKITPAQAEEIVRLLKHALENRMNVVVHCMAGLCRSGAVAEVGVMMGFEDTERFRSPNLLVKHSLMKALGWTYDANEKPNVESWRTMKLGWEQ
jgi:rhodanese-related sulfurtransferase